MPVTVRAQCIFQSDTALPRDAITINPCFRFNGAAFDGDDFCADLIDAFQGWITHYSTRPIAVRTYDVNGTKPIYPNGEAVENAAGTPPAMGSPRDLAVCLSFYAEQNIPRRRGRLYIPYGWTSTTSSGIDTKVSSTTRAKVGELATIFANAGGVDVDWVVVSKANNDYHKVTNWFVDDEWDTVRKRGLRSTARTTGTTGG